VCAAAHDCFDLPPARHRTIATATEESSARWLVARLLRHVCDRRGAPRPDTRGITRQDATASAHAVPRFATFGSDTGSPTAPPQARRCALCHPRKGDQVRRQRGDLLRAKAGAQASSAQRLFGSGRRAGGRVLREPLQREWTTYSAGGCSRGREGSDGCISRSDATGR
jgi:hypothetical protein